MVPSNGLYEYLSRKYQGRHPARLGAGGHEAAHSKTHWVISLYMLG